MWGRQGEASLTYKRVSSRDYTKVDVEENPGDIISWSDQTVINFYVLACCGHEHFDMSTFPEHIVCLDLK